jgi:hypothetical protein
MPLSVPRVKVLRYYRYEPKPPWAGPGPPRMSSRPLWAGPEPPRMSSRPLWAGLGPPCLAFKPPAGRAQVFRPACALGPHSPLGQGSGAATWPMGTWHKPSTGSKLTARIQTSDCGVSCCAQGIGRLLSGRAGLIDRSSAPHVTDASNCVSAPRAWFAQYDV